MRAERMAGELVAVFGPLNIDGLARQSGAGLIGPSPAARAMISALGVKQQTEKARRARAREAATEKPREHDHDRRQSHEGVDDDATRKGGPGNVVTPGRRRAAARSARPARRRPR